jgi:hypothetical protein
MPVPPLETASAEASVSAPFVANDEVAVEPKYAGPEAEKSVVEALWRSTSTSPILM